MFKYKACFDSDSLREIVSEHSPYFQDKLQSLRQSIGARMLFLAVKEEEHASSLIISSDTAQQALFSYSLVGTPCDTVSSCEVCVYSTGTLRLFPDDPLLQEIGLDGYMGAPIINEEGTIVGILAGLFNSIQEPVNLKSQFFGNLTEQLSIYIQKCHLDKRMHSYLSLLNEVQSIAKTGAWEFHREAKKVFWSDEIYRIYGVPIGHMLSPEEAISFYAPHSQARIREAFVKLSEEMKSYDLELEFVDSYGNAKWIRTTGRAEIGSNGELVRSYGAFEDITTSKTLELNAIEHAEKLENIINNLNDALVIINRKGQILHCNDVALRMFGYQREELFGVNVSLLMPEPYATKHDEYMRHYESTGNAKIIGVGRQLPAKRKNGDIFQMELSLTETTEKGDKQYIGLVRDISERIKAEDAIYNLAFTDNVTNLRNSQWFEKEAKQLMFKAMRQHHCIHALLLDMDKMAAFNQRFGFNVGDKALKQIADKLKAIIGHDYSIFKYDADSFIILSNKTAPKSSMHQFGASLIESALLHPDNFKVNVNGGYYSLSGSLGSAIFEPAEQSFEVILGILEHAVRSAKKRAPFGLCHIARDGIEEYDRVMAIQERVHSLSGSGELSLAFQPQFNAAAKIVGFEALIRWQSAEFGWVSPADFIPIAEENGAIFSIGEWVVASACDAAIELMSHGHHCTISINVSARQIVEPEFVLFLNRTLEEKQVPAQWLVLELTETALVSDMSQVKNTMQELAKLGFQFSVDDFGTGYSSLAYLKELPISELKVDKYFVDDITDDSLKSEYVIVDAIINMAQALGVKCVAEGVENKVQCNYLERVGCSIFQGYYYSRPLEIKDWRRLLLTGEFND